MIKPVVLDAMLLAGCTAQQIVAAVKADQEINADVEAEKREKARLRKQRQRQRENDVTSRNVTRDECDTPVPPVSDKENPPSPPKEINSSPLTPQTTLNSASAQIDFDQLQSQLVEAVGQNKIQPHASFVVGPIAELIAHGVSLEKDILPTIRAKAVKLSRPAGSWLFFVDAIREAYERRIGAVKDLAPAPQLKTSDEDWSRRLRFARKNGTWSSTEWGPPPRAAGSMVPVGLLEDGDGVNWTIAADGSRRAAA